mgnify:CR=1 FL=1
MRKTFKNLFNILTIISLLFVFGCTEDLYKDENHSNHNLTFKKVSLNEITKNKKLVEKLGKLNQKKENTVNAEGKIIYSSEYGFYVDTDYANYIEDENGKHSYVFKVYRDSVENKLDNIVFSSQEDNSYKVALISYNLTTQQQQNLANGIQINVSENSREFYVIEDENLTSDIFNKVMVISDGNGCYTIIETYISCSLHSESGYSDDPRCYSTNTYTNCSGNGGGGGGGTTGGYNNPTGNTGPITTGTTGNNTTGGSYGNNSNNNSNNSNPIYTTPTYPSPQQILKDKFIKQLTGNFLDPNNQKDCFNNLPQEQKDEILDYVGSFALELVDGSSTNTNSSTSEEAVFGFAEEAILTLCNDGEVDFDNKVLLDTSFVNSIKLKCVYDKIMSSNNSDNFFKKMINHFSNSTNKTLTFKVEVLNQPISGRKDWAITNGNPNLLNDYTIISDIDLENQSVLQIMSYLCHELIHAYMFDSLEDWGYIGFNTDGSPFILQSSLNCTNYTANTVFSSLNNQQSFEAILCALVNNNLADQFAHDLFNSTNFNGELYRTNLEQFIYNEYDWSSERLMFVNEAQLAFGINSWKNEVAKSLSWKGLESTLDYPTYINSYPTGSLSQDFINNLQVYLVLAKNNCP